MHSIGCRISKRDTGSRRALSFTSIDGVEGGCAVVNTARRHKQPRYRRSAWFIEPLAYAIRSSRSTVVVRDVDLASDRLIERSVWLHSLSAFGSQYRSLPLHSRVFLPSSSALPRSRVRGSIRRDAASLSRESGSPKDRKKGRGQAQREREKENRRRASGRGSGGGTWDVRRSDRKGIVRGGQRKILREEDNISLD
jgi:hypothetical protein